MAKQFVSKCVGWCAMVAVVGSVVGLTGCGQSGEPAPTDPGMLRGIVRAYALAQRQLRRPPQSMDELKQVLAPLTDDPSKHLSSTRDGEEFVVVWGLTLSQMPDDMVLAYERSGVKGKRMVVTMDGTVSEVTEEEFAALKFPKGHQLVEN